MKKSLRFLLASALLAGSAMAQPTLTAAGTNMVVGDQLVQTTATYTPAGSAGAGQTWNLTGMGTGTTATLTVVTPGSTTNGASFPNANVALSQNGATGYYKTSSTAWQNWGSDANSVVIAYSNAEDLLHYPFTMSNNYSDAFAATFSSSGFTFYRSGTCTVTADGYGTVITPAGSFSNCLRVHFVEAYKDSANFGVPFITTYNNDEYMWYDNAHHIAIASVSSFTATPQGSSPTVSTFGTYFGAPVGIETHLLQAASVKLFPNPAAEQLHVNVDLQQSGKIDLRIVNSLGQEVGSLLRMSGNQGENSISLDVNRYSEGIYFVQVYTDGVLSSTRRFVVSR